MYQVIDNGDGTFSFYDIISHNAESVPEEHNSLVILHNEGYRMNGGDYVERLKGADGYVQWSIRKLNVVKM